jgi:hypothetical protein
VAGVPATVPLTATAMYFPLKVFVTANLVVVALEMALQVLGMVCVTALTCALHEYHW